MAFVSIAETVTRPASEALEVWFPTDLGAQVVDEAALLAEQRAVSAAIHATVARMGTEQDLDVLDALTEEIAILLARAEELRVALAPTAVGLDPSDPWDL